ncbi:MAG: 50S ribosomal protein L3 [bacterium]
MQQVLLGQKEGMSQIYDDDGKSIPVTVVSSEDCVLVQKRTVQDQPSLQIGFDEIGENKVNKPMKGHFDAHGVSPRRVLQEFIVNDDSPLAELDEGDRIGVDIFEEGDSIDVKGKTKGRGFSGAVRRWGFGGGPMSHGGGMDRRTGSVGQSADPSRIFPGKKMPGQYGNEIETIQNLSVVRVFPEEDALFVSGSLPGPEGNTIILYNTQKGAKPVG